MALSYEYSIGSVRAREKNLLTRSDIEQLLSLKSEAEIASMLSDKGYGEGKTVEEILSSHTAQLWSYLRATAPDFSIFDPFLIQNDVHNFKVILKGTMADRDYEHLLVTPSTVDIPVMKKAIESRLMNLLPEWLRVNADKAYEALAHTGDARRSDAYVDKAAMLEMLRIGDSGESRFLEAYIKNFVFYCNIKTVLRAARTGANREYLKRALVRYEGFRKDALIQKSPTTTAKRLWKRIRSHPRHLSAGSTTALSSLRRKAASARAKARSRCWAITSAAR